MNTRLRNIGLAAVVVLAALFGGFAVAQQKPAPQKQPPGISCPCPCPGMGGSGMGGGMHGMRGGGGVMGCPMMSGGMGDVKVEKTKDGASIHLSAKDTAQVANLQRMALMMGLCMGADASGMMPGSP